MKLPLLVLFIVASALSGCGSPTISNYTPSRDSLFYLHQMRPVRASVGEFSDISGFTWGRNRLDFGCSLPGIEQEASFFRPSAYVKDALITELMASGSFSADPIAPQLRGELTLLSLRKGLLFDGVWTVEVLLTSSNGSQLRTREEHGFDSGALLGPTICHRAVENFEPAVRALLEKAIRSPEFRALLAKG